ncbi:type I pullulanase [Corynebacterium pseudotuberculosis]|uniref:type I pullulanase n=1 Tax=Corynebacterium pseudotuberculosis TaxID=1719 RepID=UPI00025936D0|nr:type I pullulanase [Corynebacterium pseudotuberculosis]AFH90530.1 type I pullulanase [Corynebacterium pseudotuberculosis 31]APB11913.1 type I pullulanase [Corynebacterium pseudotuberculosis]APB13958.1 type I pullulanase [Corynebacterium pseudotuberculosis]APB15995.1 type I pullulanase [Corynebacterium pseudotuberculosis]APB18045.1 type I pullulanase [Corynebacterium pseudotuberculosis]
MHDSPSSPASDTYEGQLGALYTSHATTFRVWAPSAHKVDLILNQESSSQRIRMASIGKGAWETTVPEDCENAVYMYRLEFDQGKVVESVDPYARAVTANGTQSVVVAPGTPLQRMPAFSSPLDAVIYEAHIRDLTISPNNGITHKGKFLGLAEPGTRTALGNRSGLDYLRSLGVTHVQLLPIFDFESIDETGNLSFDAQYNWGYDPLNYNVPEGSYSTDPTAPTCRITELKRTIDALHTAGLRVIMDVVYNHVYSTTSSPLERTAPGRYFRMTPEGTFYDGTFCGNETASEEPMMQKFLLDSVEYWAKEFALDGFRFDLMGIHDVETMNLVRERLDSIDPSILILGEGWPMGNHPDEILPAHQGNAKLMPRIAHFNESLRDTLKGSTFGEERPGLLSGSHDPQLMWTLFNNIKGGQHLPGISFTAPEQSVVYVEAHDNHTLFDRLGIALPEAEETELIQRCQLAMEVQFLSAGIVFIHAGQEFARTKCGDENSYASPDHINQFDYDRAGRLHDSVDLFRDLIAMRNDHGFMRRNSFEEIQHTTVATAITPRQLVYTVESSNTTENSFLVAINFATTEFHAPVDPGSYEEIFAQHHYVRENPPTVISEGKLSVAPLSVSIWRIMN